MQAQGLYENVQQIENTLIKSSSGAAIRIKDIAVVDQGPKIRLGQISKTYKPFTVDKDGEKHYDDSKLIDNPDVVEGTVLLQKGADADPALKGLEEKTKEVNDHILPQGVKVPSPRDTAMCGPASIRASCAPTRAWNSLCR